MTSQADWDEAKKILDDDYAPLTEAETKEYVEWVMGLYEAVFSDGTKVYEV